MPVNTKAIRKRIKSVSSTRKITKTMEMVATSKLKRAQDAVLASGPYADLLLSVMREVAARVTDRSAFPLLREFAPDLLVCASGFDGSAFDPNGRHNLTAHGYREIGRRVASFGTRVVLTQEGGYLRGYSALCLHSLVEGLLRLPEPLLEDPLAYVPDDLVEGYVREGALQRALEDWCPPFPGYHLYYPSRRQSAPAFQLLVEALRYRA